MEETLQRTTVGALNVGDRVNVERALRIGDEIGGHHVAGHVDVVGHIDQIIASPNTRQVFVRFPEVEVRPCACSAHRPVCRPLMRGTHASAEQRRLGASSASGPCWCPRAGSPSTA